MLNVIELRRLIESSTGDLTATPSAGVETLAMARRLLAAALARGQQEPPFDAQPFMPARTDGATSAEIASIAAAAIADASVPGAPSLDYQVAYRTSRAWDHFEPDRAPSWASERVAEQRLGPFVNGAGERVYFDFHRARTAVQLKFAGVPAPAALLTSLASAGADPSAFPIRPGTVWIAAHLLAPGAPSGWCGLHVRGGELRTDQPPLSMATSLICQAGGADLTLELEATADDAGDGSMGGDAANVALGVDLPAVVRLRLTSGGTQLVDVGAASLSLYGASIALGWTGAAPAHDGRLGALVVPMTAAGSITLAAAKSALFAPAGTASIVSAGWALPIVRSQMLIVTECGGAGMLVVTFGDGLRGRVPALDASDIALGEVIVAAASQQLALFAPKARQRRAERRLSLWSAIAEASDSTSTLDIEAGRVLELVWLARAGRAEVLTFNARVDARLDRPVRSDGRRFTLGAPLARISLSIDSSGRGVRVDGELPRLELAPDGVMRPIPRPSLALPNALLRTSTPTRLRLSGRIDANGRVVSGAATLTFVVYTLVPTLPDPYAANIDLSPLEGPVDSPHGEIAVRVNWRANEPAGVDLFVIDGRLDDALLPSLSPAVMPAPGDEDAATRERREADERALSQLAERFRETIGRSMREHARLLDLSSAADRFGVGLGAFDDRQSAVPELTFADGELVAPLARLRAFTVPPIQWEPVYTIQNPDLAPFPSPLRFAHDGGPALLGINSVRLVAVSPAPIVESIVADTQAAGDDRPSALLTPLPFGITALALPHRSPYHTLPGGMLSEVRPAFAEAGMRGGLQVSASGTRAIIQPTEESVALPGAAHQLRNARGLDPVTLAPVTVSVLGDMAANAVETTFNAEFGPSGWRPCVPASRIDLSGYGASLFTDWRNLGDGVAETAQVRFDVVVGRTAYEVVQIRSILYPYAVRVVRSVILQRTASGHVTREDSGWQAASDGLYQFPGAVPVVVHPGVVRAAFAVRRIRDTPHIFETADKKARLAAVLFDADLEIEGATLGHRNGRVGTQSHAGYILLPPGGAGAGIQPQPLSPAQFAELIEHEGALGGPVDCEIDVGGSGQAMRVGRVEVDVAPRPAPAAAEFAAAAWGSLKLPQPGQWTVTFRATDTEDVVPVDPQRGVSLVRQGAAGATTTQPYRFADARDLLWPSPRGEYGLIAVCDAQRVLFPAPRIERDVPAITSAARPLFADMYALSSSVGIFPSRPQTIEIPTTAYALEVLAGGGLALRLPFDRFTVTAPARDLLNSGAVRTYVEYADERGRPSEIEIRYDTRAPEPFEILVHRISVVTDIDPFKRIVLMRGRIRSILTASDLQETKVVFGSVMAPVQEIVTVLKDLGFPAPFPVVMTNSETLKLGEQRRKYKLKVGLEFELKRLTEPPSPLDPNPNRRKPGGYIETGIGRIQGEMAVGLEVEVEYNPMLLAGGTLPRLPPGTLIKPEQKGGHDLLEAPKLASLPPAHVAFYAEASADLHAPIIGQLLYAGGHFGMEIETQLSGTLQTKVKLIAGASGMVGGKIVPKLIDLEATMRRAVLLQITTDGPRPGLMIGLEGTAAIEPGEFKLVSISFGVEAQGVVERVDEEWIEYLAEVKIAADITVAHFLTTGIDIETEYRERVKTWIVASLAVAMAIPGYP